MLTKQLTRQHRRRLLRMHPPLFQTPNPHPQQQGN
jgi:hypothetical protein